MRFFLTGVICQMLFGGLCADDNMQIKGEANREKGAARRKEVPSLGLLGAPAVRERAMARWPQPPNTDNSN